MTRSKCWEHCASHNQRYAAVQAAQFCLCGNSNHDYSRHGKTNESDCYSLCGGNLNEVCGGSWGNSVFDLGEVYYITYLCKTIRR